MGGEEEWTSVRNRERVDDLGGEKEDWREERKGWRNR